MRNDFESNYLEHSAKGTSWTKKGAKYISRIKKNGKWVYQYKITGRGYKAEYAKNKLMSEEDSNLAKETTGSNKNAYAKYAEYEGRKAAEAESNYKTKSLAGITESTIQKGKNKIKDILSSLKTTETVTVTSNLMPAGTKKTIKKK